MSVTLPALPAPNGAEAALLDFGTVVKPALGGSLQRLDRMGNRHRIALTFPPMPSRDVGRVFVQRLKRAKTEGLLIEWPLLSFDVGAPGNPVVDTAGQAGRSLKLRGFTPGYAIREGQHFSIVHDGRRYLHSVDAEAVANNAGRVTVGITPMLRISPAPGALAEFGKPMVEGLVLGDEWAWQMALTHNLSMAVELHEVA